MKTSLFSFLFFLQIIICQAQSNHYHPFPNAYAGWKEQSGGYQSGECKDWGYRIIGDTTWNGLVYHKIQKKGVKYWMDNNGNCTFTVISTFNYYAGAYRNDSINKKVYFLPSSSQTDTLLYDFNLNQYNPLPNTYLYHSSYPYYSFVSLIDSVHVGNEYHKRLRIADNNYTNYVDLIEGIGSTLGLLEPIKPPLESFTALLCFEQNGVAVYPYSNGSCGVYTNIEFHSQNEIQGQLIPNPIFNYAQAVINEEFYPATLVIFDIFGNKRFTTEIIKGTMVQLAALTSGLYFYTITKREILIAKGKFIKNK